MIVRSLIKKNVLFLSQFCCFYFYRKRNIVKKKIFGDHVCIERSLFSLYIAYLNKDMVPKIKHIFISIFSTLPQNILINRKAFLTERN